MPTFARHHSFYLERKRRGEHHHSSNPYFEEILAAGFHLLLYSDSFGDLQMHSLPCRKFREQGGHRIKGWGKKESQIETTFPLAYHYLVADKESFSFFLVTTSSAYRLTLYVLWITNATRQKSSRPEKKKKSSNPLKIRSLIHFIEMQRIPLFFLISKPTFLLGQETFPLLHVTSSKVMGQLRKVEYPPQLFSEIAIQRHQPTQLFFCCVT